MDHKQYDFVIISFCGKDSLACLLHCLELGFPPEKIELWHHLVDGETPFIDWPCSGAYAQAIAKAFGIQIYFSGRFGGFKAELLRENRKSSAYYFETPDGLAEKGGGLGKVLTRRQYPHVGKIEAGRWCSALQKIDVGRSALNNQARFLGSRTLFISGERAEESKQRAGYQDFEPHVCSAKHRQIDHWRPVHKWTTQEVWQTDRPPQNKSPPLLSSRLGTVFLCRLHLLGLRSNCIVPSGTARTICRNGCTRKGI